MFKINLRIFIKIVKIMIVKGSQILLKSNNLTLFGIWLAFVEIYLLLFCQRISHKNLAILFL